MEHVTSKLKMKSDPNGTISLLIHGLVATPPCEGGMQLTQAIETQISVLHIILPSCLLTISWDFAELNFYRTAMGICMNTIWAVKRMALQPTKQL